MPHLRMILLPLLLNEAYLQSFEIRKDIQSIKHELQKAEAKLRNARRFFVRIFLKSKIPERQNAVNKIKNELEGLEESLQNSVINVDFDFNEKILNSFTGLHRSFESLRNCNTIWDITASRTNDRRIKRSAAEISVAGRPVSFNISQTEVVKSRYKALTLTNANGDDIQLCPGFAMLKGSGKDFALLDIRQISFTFCARQFVEEDPVPADSKVIGQTWKKVNKDGSRDKRSFQSHRKSCSFSLRWKRSRSNLRYPILIKTAK
jgi:hypothetical protein